jgi:hypothetical protein
VGPAPGLGGRNCRFLMGHLDGNPFDYESEKNSNIFFTGVDVHGNLNVWSLISMVIFKTYDLRKR